jgi:hypothetical protein
MATQRRVYLAAFGSPFDAAAVNRIPISERDADQNPRSLIIFSLRRAKKRIET